MQNICDDFPELPVVVEHITTREGALFVKEARMPIAATITPHHLLLNRNSIFNKGINPHHFCLPVLKSEADRMAITTAATSGNPRFFAGTDSAPHSVSNKERSGGSAGIYTAHVALELYTSIFEKAGALEKLEGFLSFAGADFYGIKRNSAKIKLHKNTWQVPESLPFAGESLVPLCAGEIMEWSVVD